MRAIAALAICHLPVFEWLTQKIEHVSPELREFIQKKDPVVGEADLTWLGHVAAADQTCIGYGMMRGAELPFNDERAVIQHCGGADYLGGLHMKPSLNCD